MISWLSCHMGDILVLLILVLVVGLLIRGLIRDRKSGKGGCGGGCKGCANAPYCHAHTRHPEP